MVDPPGQKKRDYTPKSMTTVVPAVALDMFGFRFFDSKQVFIQCVVKICKPQHAAACGTVSRQTSNVVVPCDQEKRNYTHQNDRTNSCF